LHPTIGKTLFLVVGKLRRELLEWDGKKLRKKIVFHFFIATSGVCTSNILFKR
jgi:hypothetical protein